MTDNATKNAVVQFTQQYTEQFEQAHGHLPVAEKDAQWPSPCEAGDKDNEYCFWTPKPIADDINFDNVEQALELSFHQDIKDYFLSVYSEDIHASHSEGRLSLLFAWNQDDFDRLQQNIIGHILMKRKLKQAETVFLR